MGKNDIQWCNDFNVYRPRSRTSCRLDATPSKSWANSRRANSSSSINQRFVRFFKTFSPIRAPRDLLATRGLSSHLSSPPPVGLPIIDTVAALDACFWNTSLPAKRNTNLHRRLLPSSVSLYPRIGGGDGVALVLEKWSFSKIDLDSMQLQSRCGNARLLISRPTIARPSLSDEIHLVNWGWIRWSFIEGISKIEDTREIRSLLIAISRFSFFSFFHYVIFHWCFP